MTTHDDATAAAAANKKLMTPNRLLDAYAAGGDTNGEMRPSAVAAGCFTYKHHIPVTCMPRGAAGTNNIIYVRVDWRRPLGRFRIAWLTTVFDDLMLHN